MIASIRLLRTCRRAIAAAMIAAYVAVMSGMPLPTATRPAKSNEQFPCATSGCGCDSAERCWSSCCCHTLAERLAWAKEHGVRPPDFALAEARNAGLDTSAWERGHKLVHAAVAAKSCCPTKTQAATPSCCRQRIDAARTCCERRESSPHVIGWRALACHGQSLHWLAAVPTLIPTPPQLSHELPLVAWLGPATSDAPSGICDAPAVPPPERA